MCLVPVTVGGTHMRKLLVVAGVVAFSLPAIAQDTPTRVTPDALTWKENAAFPKGVQIATLVGDPTKAGDVVVFRQSTLTTPGLETRRGFSKFSSSVLGASITSTQQMIRGNSNHGPFRI
jgi:hypothetical protein